MNYILNFIEKKNIFLQIYYKTNFLNFINILYKLLQY